MNKKRFEKVKCPLCDCYICDGMQYMVAHLRRTHKMQSNQTILTFINTNFTSNSSEECTARFFNNMTCSICDTTEIDLAKIFKNISFKTMTYELEDLPRYICNNIECKNKISLTVLGIPYNSKKYEHIGSMPEYNNIVYKLYLYDSNTAEIIKNNLKGKNYAASLTDEELTARRIKSSNNLQGFIVRYGVDIGTLKYNEYKNTISKSKTLARYIEKFGIALGTKKYNDYCDKQKRAYNTISKKSIEFSNILKSNNIEFEIEYKYDEKIFNRADFYLKNTNTIIEFFGDYWHANPVKYSNTFYNTKIKMTAEDIWKKDAARITNMLNLNYNVIVIWESALTKHNYSKIIESINNHLHNSIRYTII